MQRHGGDVQQWPETGPSDPPLYPSSSITKAISTIEHLTNEVVTEVDDVSIHKLNMRIAAISMYCQFSLRQMVLLPSNDSAPPMINFYILILAEFRHDMYSNNPIKLIHDKEIYYHQALNFCIPVAGRSWDFHTKTPKVLKKGPSRINFTNEGSGSPSHTLLFPNCSDFELNNCIITTYGSDPTARERSDRWLLLEYRLLGALWISIAVLFY